MTIQALPTSFPRTSLTLLIYSFPAGGRLSEAEAAIWAANLAAGPNSHLCPAVASSVASGETSALLKDDLPPVSSANSFSSSPSESTFSQYLAASLLSPFSGTKPRAPGLEILTKKKKDSPKHSYILSRFGSTLDLPDDEFETSPVVIELTSFLDCVDRCEAACDYTTLNALIKQVFSSPEALNQSFLKKELVFPLCESLSFSHRLVQFFRHVKADLRNLSGSRLEEQAALQMGMIDLDAISLVYSTITDRVCSLSEIPLFNSLSILCRTIQGTLLFPLWRFCSWNYNRWRKSLLLIFGVSAFSLFSFPHRSSGRRHCRTTAS